MSETAVPPILPATQNVPENYEEQTDLTPKPKVVAAGLAGAVTVIVLWLSQEFANVNVPTTVGAALTTILSFIAGYLKIED